MTLGDRSLTSAVGLCLPQPQLVTNPQAFPFPVGLSHSQPLPPKPRQWQTSLGPHRRHGKECKLFELLLHILSVVLGTLQPHFILALGTGILGSITSKGI